jgi:DNA-binding NarL/FixJ family response regulator
MRILLIIDDARTRLALQFHLSNQPNVVLVGAVDHTTDPALLVAGTCPDLVILDWDSHHPTGVQVLKAIRAVDDHSKIIVLSSDLDAEEATLAAGADAFFSKGEPPDQLLVKAYRMSAARGTRADRFSPPSP